MMRRGQRHCFAFSSPRGCRKKNCEYPHIKPDSADNVQPTTDSNHRFQQNKPTSNHAIQHNSEDTDRDAKQRLRRWKTQIPVANQKGAPPLQHRLAAWVQEGYNLVKSTHSDARQQIVQDLHSEGGLMRVRELLEMAPATESIRSDDQYLSALAAPLLLTISHHEVANSALLEHAVDGIHIYIFGTGGRRAVPFFTCLSAIFASTTTFTSAITEALLAALMVMQRMVDLNGTAQVNKDLGSVVETIEELLLRPDLVDDVRIASSRKLLRRIKQRMGLGLAIPEADRAKNHIPLESPPMFDIGRDLPGMLSSAGPRHDNDHDDITKIQILPTQDEVASIGRSEYLPIRDPRSLHLPGVKGLLDRHFRLVREDTVGQLRDAVRSELQKLRTVPRSVSDNRSGGKGARTSIYNSIRLEKLYFDQDGICADVSFEQPGFLLSRSPKDREQYYESRKCLRHDSLLCLVGTAGSLAFFSVTGTRSSQNKTSERTASRLWQDVRGCIAMRLTEPYQFDIQRMMQCFANHAGEQKILVEFPGVLLPAFYHTLAALKRMSATAELPFAEMIAPEANTNSQTVNPGFPQYSLTPRFTFDLSSLIDNQDNLELQPNSRFDYDKLQAHSTLDDAQQKAVIDALTTRLALIQGPPGTGKSYTGVFLIKALLANAKKASLGPIICVCYTNHALDQLLEHLVRQEVQQVIRIGGQSKSELLKPINLREVSHTMDTTATERKMRWELKQSSQELSVSIAAALAGLEAPGAWDRIRTYLELEQSSRLAELESLLGQVDDQGFQTVSYDKRSPLEQWLEPSTHARSSVPHSNYIRGLHNLQYVGIFDMTMAERTMLYQQWQAEITESLTNELMIYLEQASKIRNGLQRCRQEQDLRCLRKASVIGITTTGLARNLDLLRHLSSKVLICEEAGEVLEAHLLTAMLPNLEHCILIGDHEQLRPQIANYELQSTNRRGEQYSLDVSLFERLIHPPYPCMSKVPYSTLEIQRRMHPSIAELIASTLYPKLKDHSSVQAYPEVKGIAKRLYWLDHRHSETRQENTDSKTNDYEVELTAALLTHLVRQGEYQAEDIAILTPYLGQLVKLKKRLASQFEIVTDEKDDLELQKQGLNDHLETPPTCNTRRTTLLKALRLASVDNFQGEEAKVVVVSLVRSNKENKCGFLSTTNRINVLLSRARHGMYLLGDSTCYQSIPMWEHVLQILRRDGNIGEALPLQCPRHMGTIMPVSVPDDFLRQSPEGGCDRRCGERLDCGHACPNKCHARTLHDAVVCLVPCPRARKGCAHPCPKACGEDCGRCVVRIPDVLLPCGHTSTEKCFVTQDTSLALCTTNVEKVISGCNHTVQLQCHKSLDQLDRCPAICGALLSCGHQCRSKCQDCNKREDGEVLQTIHGKCNFPCGNKYNTCEHSCTEPCHRAKSSCKPCDKRCNVYCNHSTCSKSCQEPCAPCAETCNAGCEHTGLCPLPCSVPCDIIPCSKRCEKVLKCGHQCPSVCGERCPTEKHCQLCASSEIKQKIVDYTEFSQYSNMDLDNDPCYVLACGHILSIGSLDGIMQIEEHYEIDDNHKILGIKGVSKPFSVEQKFCPECRYPLRNLQRYNRIWRRGQLDESTKKFIAWSMASFVPLSKRVDHLESHLSKTKTWEATVEGQSVEVGEDQGAVLDLELSGTRDEVAAVILGIKNLRSRYRELAKLRRRINKYLEQVTEDEQPFGRVYNMLQSIRQTQDGVSVGMVHDESVLQTRQRLQATSLSLRCDLVILADFLQLRNDNSTTFAGKYDWRSVKLNMQLERARHECLRLAAESRERTLPATQVEALVYFARFTALEWSIPDDLKRAQLSNIRDEALAQLDQAREICKASPSTAGLLQEIEQAEKSLRDSTFYATVTNEERRLIVAAMATEFQVNGHWYRCPNGHPFTIANCGQAMQESNCPECGATVGGSHHRLTAGNTRATDIEEEFGRMAL